MYTLKIYERHIGVGVVAVAICLAFFLIGGNFAHAEENVEATDETEEMSKDDSAKRSALLEKIESLKAMLAENKAAREENREAFKAKAADLKEERKEEFKINKDEFFASLTGLSEEERKAAMMEFIANLRAAIAEKKAAHIEKVETIKEERKEDKDEFRSSLEGLTKEQKLDAMLERVKAIRMQIEERAKKLTGEEDDNDEDGSEEDEVEDENESEDDDEGEDEETDS